MSFHCVFEFIQYIGNILNSLVATMSMLAQRLPRIQVKCVFTISSHLSGDFTLLISARLAVVLQVNVLTRIISQSLIVKLCHRTLQRQPAILGVIFFGRADLEILV